jgi:hypothetical protein
MRIDIAIGGLGALLACIASCSSEDSDGGTSANEGAGGAGASSSTAAGPGSSSATGASTSASSTGAGTSSGSGGGTAAAWIEAHLADAPVVTGDFTERVKVETPALIRDATGCCAKYAFDMEETRAPDDRRVGLVNVAIHELTSGDAYGGGISSAYAPGLVLYLANVTITPNWPTWESYATTNYDGMVLDESSAIYAEDLTIADWNADGAIDNKAPISQFVRLTIAGQGNRGIRYWGPGPHYLVDSHLENLGGSGEGSLLWFSDCDAAVVNIYGSTFNGADTVPAELVSCDNGSAPTLNYLTTDPRTTGEMHEMFSP